MRTNPVQRKRIASQVLTLGLSRIKQGIFGSGAPSSGDSAVGLAPGRAAVYTFHEGDLFTPGTGNFVLDPSMETPVNTSWGHGIEYPNGVFATIQAHQVWYPQAVPAAGIVGIISGTPQLTPLLPFNPSQPVPAAALAALQAQTIPVSATGGGAAE